MMSHWWTGLRFVAGAALAVGIAYAVSESVAPVNPELKRSVSQLRAQRDSVEVVTVGNSQSTAISFDEMGVRGVHFWSGGQDVFEAAHLARYAVREGRGLRYVLLAASYGVQVVDHAVPTQPDLTGRRRAVYAQTPLLGPLPGDLRLWVAGKAAPVARPDHWRRVALILKQRTTGRERERAAAGAAGRAAQTLPAPADSLERYSATVGALQRALAVETLAADPTTPSRAAEQLHALAGELRARGVALVLYTPPYHESYLRERVPSITAEMRGVLEGVVRANENAVWLDFSDHPDFVRQDALFRTSDHLRPAGTRHFSTLLRRCLNAMGTGTGMGGPPAPGCPPGRPPVASGAHAPAPVAPSPAPYRSPR